MLNVMKLVRHLRWPEGVVVRQASVGLSIIREKKISFVPESYALPTLRS